MLAHVTTFAIQGVESRRVTVEVDIRPGLPAFTIVGLGDLAVRESRERVRSAILNSGFEFPARRITVNLAPAALRKEGPGFDLAIACGVLAAVGELPASVLERVAVFGELALGGELRPCRGVLAVAEGAVAAGLGGLVLPAVHGREAALVDDLGVFGAIGLAEVVAILRGESDGQPPPPDDCGVTAPVGRERDLADVRGHAGPLRALTIAAAGGHNLLLAGPPGTGKTMLAQRLPSILPPLARPEAIEVTRIQSVAGVRPGAGLVTERPFRAPHHTISASGLVGGGLQPLPGEATLAHHGVLFLESRTLQSSERNTMQHKAFGVWLAHPIVLLGFALTAGNAHAQSPEAITFRDAKTASAYTHREIAEMLVTHGKAKVRVRGCVRQSRTVIVCRVVVTGDSQVLTDRCFVRLTDGGNYATWLRDIQTRSRSQKIASQVGKV